MRPQQFAGLLAVVLGGVTLAGAAVSRSYVGVGPGGSACCLVPDGHGNLYGVGSFAGFSGTSISVTRLDAGNHVAAVSRLAAGGRTLREPPRSIRRGTW
jgi:hypothetical protein